MEKNHTADREKDRFVLDTSSFRDHKTLYEAVLEKTKGLGDSNVLFANLTSDEVVRVVKASEAQLDQDIRRVGGWDNIHGGGGHGSTEIITSDNKTVPVSCCVLCWENDNEKRGDLEHLTSGVVLPVQEAYWWDDEAEREIKEIRDRMRSVEADLVQ